jgi:arginine-tRNA-protein transferase
VLEPASFTQEKYELYKNYQINVHHDEPEEVSERGFKRFLCDSPLVACLFVWFYYYLISID